MKKTTTKVILLLVGLAGLAVAIGILLRNGQPEPSYEGKSLSQWLSALNYSYSPTDRQASNAVHHMGTNILPFLRPMLRAHDSRAKLLAIQILSKQHLVKFNFVPANEKRERASRACRVLGPAALEYLPELTTMLDSTNSATAWCGYVAICDVKPGAQGIPEITKALTNASSQVRWVAASRLGGFGETASSATPWLSKCLLDPDVEVRLHAIKSLIQIKADQSIVFPQVITALNDTNANSRMQLIFQLGNLGSNALPLKAQIAERLQDTDAGVRSAAEQALKKLEGF
jgi:HEAT repeat protein